jgi:hypothetical protein
MTKISIKHLRISLEDAVSGENFDREEVKQRTSIQPVDLIFEFENHSLFVEVKDPDIPGASKPDGFKEKLQSGKVIRKVAGKFRDTLYFRINSGEQDKKVKYVFLLSMASLDSALLVTKQDELRQSLPASHPLWENNLTCVIMNVEQWKRKFGDDSITRISAH